MRTSLLRPIFLLSLTVLGPLSGSALGGPISYNAVYTGVTNANAVNSQGDVAGYVCNPNCNAVLYHNGAITQLGLLPGGDMSIANGINDSGVVVGYGTTGGPGLNGFIWSNGVFTDLGTLGGTQTIGQAINAAGQVTGQSNLASGRPHAFIYENGTLTDLNTPLASRGYGINSSGVVVGSASNALFQSHPFSDDHGTITDLGVFGGGFTSGTAYGINASGVVVGDNFNPSIGKTEAFIYSNGILQDLGTLGGVGSSARAINASGTIVGQASSVGRPNGEAFVYLGGTMYSLTDLVVTGLPANTRFGMADAINASGQIVTSDGWLLTPTSQAATPEPGTWILFAGPLAALGIGRRRTPRYR